MVNKSSATSLFQIPYNNTGDIQKKNAEGSFPIFNETLNRAVDRSVNDNTYRKMNFANNVKKSNSYQEIISSSHQTRSKKEVLKSRDIDDNAEQEVLKKQDKEKLVKECLAENLGISFCELESLLNEFKIDITNIEQNSETFGNLVVSLGLDSKEEKVLLKVIELVKEEVENLEVINKEYLVETNEKEDWIKVSNIEVEEGTATIGKDELSLRIKKGLKELLNKNAEELPKEIGKSVKEIAEKTINPIIKKTEVTTKEGEMLDDKNNKNYTEVKQTTVEQSNSKSKEESEVEDDFFRQRDEMMEGKTNDGERVEFQSLFSENIKNSTKLKELVNNQRSEIITKKEITFQIVEKAKVLLDGNKSEMIMDLKPDHLGKLSLKLITERGIVAAKFIAENDQVRAAIEANMDTLKESLEKQGFSIQEFSVSVNQNKDNHQNENNGSSNALRKTSKKGLSGNISSTDVTMEIEKNNPYIISDSSINLTA